jgi:AcrR family transcriptional regulator
MSTKLVIDRRIAKTRLALRDALLSLLADRGWDELNIQEICDRANVGRSTFYIHYRSKEDLLAEGLNDLRDALRLIKPDNAAAHPPLAFMPGLLAHMVEQRQIFKTVIGRRSGHSIERRFRDMVFQLIEHDLARLSLPSLQHQLLARYTAGGVVDIMAWWVDAPEAPKVDVLERLLKEFVRAALHVPLIAQHLQSDQNNMSLTP